MSYIVLARKWRPQNFDDLTGQEVVARTLKNALSHKKVPHAFLFSGPRGVGKTSAARILAKALNCTDENNSEPCNQCLNCTAITNGSSVDVIEIDGASNNSVEDVRGLRESVKYAPSSCKYKIYIVDEVHMLSREAFNALLKTLEEPPSHVVFVFATTEPKKVPSTILSRCQHHAFRKIPKAKIKERLVKIVQAEKISIKNPAIEMIARAADGSMRDALTILDQASSFSDEIGEKELQILLGLPETDIVTGISDSIISGDISGTLKTIKELSERGYDLKTMVRELIEHFRNIAVVKVVDEPEKFLEFTEEEVNKLRSQASQLSTEELTLLLSEFLKLDNEVKNSLNPRYTLELGLLRTSFIKGMTSIPELLKRLSSQDELNEQIDKNKREKTPLKKNTFNKTLSINEKKENKTQISHDPQNRLWEQVIETMKTKDQLLACKLAEAKLININETVLTIGFNGGMSVLADSVKKKAPVIESIIEEVAGNQMRLNIVSLPVSEINANEIKEKIFSDPFVKNAMELFNGTLLRVRSLKDKGT
jgi:DNA polymerase-3 subunit gamma/tau